MKISRLFRLELNRLLSGPATRLVLALTALSPALWLLLYRMMGAALGIVATMNDLYIAYPAMAGGAAGAALFALLTVRQLDAPHRFRVTAITDAMVSPLTQALIRLLALLTAAGAAQLAALLLWLPYTVLRVGAVFSLEVYLLSYAVLMLPPVLIAVLFSAAVCQLTRRADLTLMAFAVFAALSLTAWGDRWQLRWLIPAFYALSDDFSNFRTFRTIGYARMTWLLALAGLWTVSWLCVRQYGKGLWGSLLRSARRIYRPVIAALLLAAAGLAYVGQPFYDHSSPDLSQSILDIEPDPALTCPSQYAQVVPDPETGSIHGRVVYQLRNAGGTERTLELVAIPGCDFSSVRANGRDVPWSWTDIQMDRGRVAAISLPAEAEIALEVVYGGFPREWNLADSNPSEPEISGTYMRLENWLLYPRLRNNSPLEEGISSVMDITLPERMLPVLFGPEKEELLRTNEDGTRTWRCAFRGKGTILYAGDYVRRDIQASGLNIAFYYGRKHEAILEEAQVEEAVRRVVEYCTEHIGPLQFYTDGSLKLLMTRVAGGGYAGDGASTMDEADFTAGNLLDASKGSDSGAVMIHELVHQWWGLGNMFDQADGTDPWSAEGLTVYTTYRIVKEMYGEAFARANYTDQWRREVEDYYQNFYVRNPAYLSALPEAYRLNISNSLSGVRRYSEMPLKILRAEELAGGEEAMDEILNRLFTRELDWTYPYLTYQEFLDACGLTEEDLRLD